MEWDTKTILGAVGFLITGGALWKGLDAFIDFLKARSDIRIKESESHSGIYRVDREWTFQKQQEMIEDLQKELKEFRVAIDHAQAEHSQCREQLASHKTQLASANEQIVQLREQLAQASKRIDSLERRKP